MIELYFDTDNTQLPPLSDSLIPIHLYGSPAKNGEYASIGRPLLNEIRRIKEDLDETVQVVDIQESLEIDYGIIYLKKDKNLLVREFIKCLNSFL